MKTNVNISNELSFSDVHRSVNYIMTPSTSNQIVESLGLF